MATRIRLKRLGRRNRPFYRIIIIDSRKRRDGAAIEEVGWYDPILKKDKNVVKNLMKKTGLAHKWHLLKMGLNDEEIEKSMQKWELDKDLTLKLRAERAEEKTQLKKKEAEEAKEVEEEAKKESSDTEEPSDEPEAAEDTESVKEDEGKEEDVSEADKDESKDESSDTEEPSDEQEEGTTDASSKKTDKKKKNPSD